jgi:hypothetical protein
MITKTVPFISPTYINCANGKYSTETGGKGNPDTKEKGFPFFIIILLLSYILFIGL